MYKFMLIVMVIGVLFAANVSAKKSESPVDGFILVSYASEKFKPGYVYRFAKGKEYEVTRWPFNTECETIEVPHINTKAAASVAGVLSFLKLSSLGVKLNGEYKNLLDVDFNVIEPCSRVMNDEAYKELRKQYSPKLIDIMGDSKYRHFEFYVVRESIETSKMDFVVKTKTDLEVGLWAKFKRLIKADFRVKNNNDSVIDFSFTKSKKLVVLIKVERFYTESNSSGGIVLKSEKMTKQLFFIENDNGD